MITYACGHKKDYCPGRDILSHNLCYQCTMTLVGSEVTFVRFGAPPIEGYSWNYAERRPELGISVYLVQDNIVRGTIRCEFADRPAYIGKGIVLGTGGDDEIVVEIITCRKASKRDKTRLNVSK